MSDEPKNNNNKFIIGAVIALVLVCCCCGGGGIFSAIGTGALTRFNARMKVEQVSMNPMAKARANDRVIALLGAPIREDARPDGDIDKINSGIADYSRHLIGAKAEGTLVIKARRVDKTWIYEAVHVDVGGESIDLMPVDSLELVETSE
jgi:hypothetical protein